jgi:CBS domain-containing protein
MGGATPVLRAGAPLLEALVALLETGASALPVMADGTDRPAGYITLAAIAREIARAQSGEALGREEPRPFPAPLSR